MAEKVENNESQHHCGQLERITRMETIIEENLSGLPEQLKLLLVSTNQTNLMLRFFKKETEVKLMIFEADIKEIKQHKAAIAETKLDKEYFYKWEKEKFEPVQKEILNISKLKWQISGAVAAVMVLWNIAWPYLEKLLHK